MSHKNIIFYFMILLFAQSCSLLSIVDDNYKQVKGEFFSKSKKVENKKEAEIETSPIINGESVAEKDLLRDSVALIKMNKSNQSSICTGVLVSRNSLLTAAHCLKAFSKEEIKVVLYKDQSNKSIELEVKEYFIHPQYNGKTQSYSDLAIIRLSQDLEKDRVFLPIVKDTQSIKSDEVELVGFGVSEEKLSDSQVLRKVRKSFKNEIFLRGAIVGVGQKNGAGGFCRGDSGAPVIVDATSSPKVLGINSFTIEFEKGKECQSASVSISLPHNSEWINKKIN